MAESLSADARELLALSGVACCLILCNVSFMTRDSLLLYSTLRFLVDVASLQRVPTGFQGPLLTLVQAWGVDGRLLHQIESQPVVLSEFSGQWAVAERTGSSVTVCAHLYSRSDLDEALDSILTMGALAGPTDLALSCLGITAAMQRAKRHESFPWTTLSAELEALAPDAHTTSLLNAAREAKVGRSFSTEEVQEAWSLRARELCVLLLCALPLVSFRASGPAAGAAALLASPSFAPRDPLVVAGLVLAVLRSIGLDGKAAADIASLTQHPHGSGSPGFKSSYLALVQSLEQQVGRSAQTERALAALQRHGHRTPDIIADARVLSSSSVVRLGNFLESVCKILPPSRRVEERVPTKNVDHAPSEAALDNKMRNIAPEASGAMQALRAAKQLPEGPERQRAIDVAQKAWADIKQARHQLSMSASVDPAFGALAHEDEQAARNLSPEAASAARAGAGLVHLLRSATHEAVEP